MSGNLMVRLIDRARVVGGKMTYEKARALASHPDDDVRRRLAARRDVRPEILYYLAEDSSPEVRREIAANAMTPPKADLLLARDGDEHVRCELAGKIAKLMPDLSSDTQDRLRDITINVLEILARDQLSRVRQILADTLKDVANAPPHVIRWLAKDAEIAVAAPVLQFSPLLTDTDLLEIVESAPVQGALGAVSRRFGLSARICDAIVENDDRDAVAYLLGNASAQMREETLDYIAERSRKVTAWQAPLVRRPRLPRATARKLAGFAADSLLSELMRRRDFAPDVLEEVAAVVRQRLGEDGPGAAAASSCAEGVEVGGRLDPIAMSEKGSRLADYVQRLYVRGELDADAIDEALSLGNEEFVQLALAVKAGVAPTMVSRIVAARSAKGTTALAWKAGLDMRCAIRLQTRLARVSPADVLHPQQEADYPLTPEEMNWLINFFSE